MPTRRRRRALESAIFEATFAELADGTFETLTLDRVTTRAGAGKASVYRRWRTPTELVLDALTYLDGELLPPIEPIACELRADLLAALSDLAKLLDTSSGAPPSATRSRPPSSRRPWSAADQN